MADMDRSGFLWCIFGNSMRIYVLTLAFLAGLFSCRTKDKADLVATKTSSQDGEKVQPADFQPSIEIVFPVIVDTLATDHTEGKRSATWLSTVRYGFFYIGPPRDTLYINTSQTPVPPPPPKKGSRAAKYKKKPEYIDPVRDHYIDWQDNRWFKYWDEANLEIKLDTNSLINGSYPVLVANTGEDTVCIGYGVFGAIMPLIMEAKDSIGAWRAIEESFVYACGNGVSSVILPPGEVALTLVQPYQGNYKTEFRLSLGKSQSPTFDGTMNYRQFESMFGRDGDYKVEYKRENNID